MAFRAPRDFLSINCDLHLFIRIRSFTIDASMGCKAPMGFNELGRGNSSPTLQCIDILCEAHVEEALLSKKTYEGVCNSWAEFAWLEFASKGINCRTARTMNVTFRIARVEIYNSQGAGFSLK